MRNKKFGLLLCLVLIVSMFAAVGSAGAAEAGKAVATDFGPSHNEADWQLGSKPDANTLRVEDGELKFEGAEDNSYFGPVGVYSKFALSFDINAFEGNSSWAGLSFGLPQPDSFFGESEPYLLIFTNDSVILLRNGASETIEWADPAQRWLPADYALAVKEEPLNVKVAYDGGKLEVYYKLQSESADLMKEPRAVFNNLPEISGHISLTTSGNADIQGWFALDNVSVSPDPAAEWGAAIAGGAQGGQTDGANEATTGNEAATGNGAEQPAPEAPEASNETVPNPQTSDSSNIMLYAALMIAALVMLMVLARTKKAADQ